MKEILRKILPVKVFYYLVEIKNFFFPSTSYLQSKVKLNESMNFYSKFIKSGDLVFDIGANYGGKTQIFIKLEAKVIAVEPQYQCVQFLKSFYGKKINIVMKGIADKEGTLDFFISESSTLSTFSQHWVDDVMKNRNNSYISSKVLKMPVTTLDNLIDEFGLPGLIKIDVEGFELEALKGLTHKVNYISFEYAVPENFESLIKCLERIHEIGEVELNYSVGESMKLNFETWVSPDVFLKFVYSSEFGDTVAGDIYIHFK